MGVNRGHNWNARETNERADYDGNPLGPIHDDRNIPVSGFPAQFHELSNPKYCELIAVGRWDLRLMAIVADGLYFLKE